MRYHVFQNFWTKGAVSLYRCFILSYCKYCDVVWHHCDVNTIRVEKIQTRALPVILNDNKSPYNDLLQKTGQSLINTYTLRSVVFETVKGMSKLNPSFIHFIFIYFMSKTMCTIDKVENY